MNIGPELNVRIQEIVIKEEEQIRPIDEEHLNLLTQTMELDGQTDPLFVKKVGNATILVAGFHRFYAMKRAGKGRVRVKYIEFANEIEELAFKARENLLHHDMTPIETARVIERMLAKEPNLSGRKIGTMLGVSERWARQLVQDLKSGVIDLAEERGITLTEAREIINGGFVTAKVGTRADFGQIVTESEEYYETVGKGEEGLTEEHPQSLPETSPPSPEIPPETGWEERSTEGVAGAYEGFPSSVETVAEEKSIPSEIPSATDTDKTFDKIRRTFRKANEEFCEVYTMLKSLNFKVDRKTYTCITDKLDLWNHYIQETLESLTVMDDEWLNRKVWFMDKDEKERAGLVMGKYKNGTYSIKCLGDGKIYTLPPRKMREMNA